MILITPTQELIEQECYYIRDMLLEKNRKYGDSAINPVRIFSRSDAIEQINVRIDDKLSRIASGQGDDTEDAELDLIGYLILKRVKQRAGRIVDHLKNRLDREAQQAAATLMPNISESEDEWAEITSPDPSGVTIPTAEEMGYIDDPDREQRITDLGFICRSRREQAVDGVNA